MDIAVSEVAPRQGEARDHEEYHDRDLAVRRNQMSEVALEKAVIGSLSQSA